MKKNTWLLHKMMVVLLLLITVAAAANPQQAFAFKLEVTNNQDHTMNFTIVKYEDTEQKF